MRIADKPNTVEITKRFLQLADEVILEGLAKNKVEFCESVGEYQQNFTRFETMKRAPTLEVIALSCICKSLHFKKMRAFFFTKMSKRLPNLIFFFKPYSLSIQHSVVLTFSRVTC